MARPVWSFACVAALLLAAAMPRSAAAQAGADSQAATPKAAAAVPARAELTAAVDHLVAQLGLGGAGLAVGRADGAWHLSVHGDLRADTALPIASASKWLAVATVLTLVDDGRLDLDAPVARWLPEFDRPDKRIITLRQCLSCTAGFAPQPAFARGDKLDFDGLLRAIAEHPLQGDPGLQFEYGGASFQVAAAAAVRVFGGDWHTLFRTRIAEPLGLRATAFGRLLPIGAEAGTTAAPWVAGGAVSSLRDYERFVRMLVRGGEIDGVRILKPATVAAMFAPATTGMSVRMRAFGDEKELAYGLGTWLQPLDGGAVRGSDPGAFGFLPWFDRDLGVYGVLALRDTVARVLPRAEPIQALVRELAQAPPFAGVDEVVALAHGGRDRRYLLHTPPGAERAERLPLLLVLHGGGGNGKQVAESTGFSALADRHGFVVAYPDGTGPLRGRLLTWNSGGIDVYAAEQKIDDVAFLRAVVASIKTKVAVDPDRIYATGMSNGAMMCHRLAREAADVFAAIAPVAGAMDFTAVDAKTPIAVLIVHGSADERVRYEGGRPDGLGAAANRVDASVAAAIAYYRARNGLAAESRRVVDGRIAVENWTRLTDGADRPAAPLRVVTIDGGGHAWPGARTPNLLGERTADWDASAAVWAFVSAQRLWRE